MGEKTVLDLIRDFHRALGTNDFERLARLLDPGVVWRASPPSYDLCADREEVLARLRELEGPLPPLESLEIVNLNDEVLVGIPTHEPWDHAEFYQRVRFRDGVISAIQDYESREDALAH